jgi:hypothetical protein
LHLSDRAVRAAEEVGQLGIAEMLGIPDVALKLHAVLQALRGEPDDA